MLRWQSGALADPRPRHPAALQYRQRSASTAPLRELSSHYGPCLRAPCLNISKDLAQGQLAASRAPDDQLCDPHSHRATGALPSLFKTAAKLLGTVALVLSAASIGSVEQARAETRGTAISSTAFSTTAPSSTPYRGSASAHGSLGGQPATSTSQYRHTGIDLAEGQQASTGDGTHDVRPRTGLFSQSLRVGTATYGLAQAVEVPPPAHQPYHEEGRTDSPGFQGGVDQAAWLQAGGGTLLESYAEVLFKGDGKGGSQARLELSEDTFSSEFHEDTQEVTLGQPAPFAATWDNAASLQVLSYSQLRALAAEGHVAQVRMFGPELRAAMVQLRDSAPGGARTCEVELRADPELYEHLVAHGVQLLTHPYTEEWRLQEAFANQVRLYTLPFMFFSALFWLMHTWLLDPLPNAFSRQEMLRHKRDALDVSTKLNFRTPAREVRIDKEGPDFIPWDEIHGIDAVKREINEIIEYLKNPALLRQRGVSRIGGVLLAGAPGTGKTLLAKAIAAESGVRMFTCSGTDFFDIYTGVGPRRIRETFQKMRDNAPAILFVDEFDALGAARSGSGQGDESAAIINEMLVQMDGFEDNRGVVVLGATNRPGAIDGALVRPGRFDRIVYMPLPDAAGRAKILQVHARNKAVDPSINWYEVARAMAGFTGADCMGLMQRAQRMAGRQGRDAITEDDMYAAMENKAMETFSEYNDALKMGVDSGLPTPIPQSLRKAIANYEAARALIAYITPDYEEIARVSVCPANVITGYTLFVEDEDKTAGAIMTRSEMEAHMVVHLAGRCAEKLTTREGEATAMCGPDMHHVNMIAREMVFSMGMGRRTGPMDMMYTHIPNDMCGAMVKDRGTEANTELLYYDATYASTEQGRVAMLDVLEVLESAEAKAYYGLATNWKGLQALTNALLDQGVLQGREVGHILEKSGVIHFTDPLIAGFGWDADGDLIYPLKPDKAVTAGEGSKQPSNSQQPKPALKGAHAKTWFAGTDKDAPRNPDGTFVANWHWGMPYSLRRDVPPDIKLAAPAPLPRHADAASMSPA